MGRETSFFTVVWTGSGRFSEVSVSTRKKSMMREAHKRRDLVRGRFRIQRITHIFAHDRAVRAGIGRFIAGVFFLCVFALLFCQSYDRLSFDVCDVNQDQVYAF